MGFDYAIKALGIGSPAMFATATYGLFYWLDRNASVQAIGAISGWLKGQRYSQLSVAPVLIGLFERIYTSKLLSFRGFRRSVAVSFITWVIFAVVTAHLYTPQEPTIDLVTIVGLVLYFSLSFLVDYLSLFAVRRCLLFATDHLAISLLLSFLMGISAVVFFGCIFVISLLIFVLLRFHGITSLYLAVTPIMWNDLFQLFSQDPTSLLILLPPSLVHIWLLLFAVGALSVRMLYPMFRVITWAQWFLRQGDRHPIRAIGMVAAALSFVVAVIWNAAAVT